ncbi:MAG: T9SS type A sorting domain-containing protein [Calditrichaeota bacterium]|nr:T9SS type A sorting domain-containing protein [Calditrichota bacterium]MCB9365764.1 T9SS type A sorting domain-containing protein [Calditrichota bacterium]
MARNTQGKQQLKHIWAVWLWVGILAIGMTPFRNALQAADQQVDIYSQFASEDSAFKTVFDPFVSPGKGMGWKPYNRYLWFYGQRLTPGLDVDPVTKRMEAWQNKRDGREEQSPLDESWSNIGPTNYAGRMLSIAWNPSNTQIIYAGSASGGLWKTTNGGTSWTPLTDDLPSLAIGAVVLDPTNPNIIYIGTGEGSFNADAVFGAGVFKSTDGGATWNTTGLSWTQSQSRAINKMVIDPNNPQIVYAACNSAIGGIYKTTDGGTSWTRYHTGDVKDIEMHPDSSNVLYCTVGYPWGGSTNGIYKSTNSGVTWTQLTSGLPSGTSFGRLDVAISPSNPAVLYAGISQTITSGAGLYGVYRSTDYGASWSLRASTPNMYSGQGWYNLVCEVNPTNSNEVWSNGLDAYRSQDGGATWTRMTIWSYPESNSQYAHADHHAMAFMPGSSTTMILGTDGGLFKSTNGGTSWVGLNSGLVTYQYYAICDDALQPNVAYGGTQDNGTNKYNNSSTHTRVLGGDGGYCNVDYTNSNNVYAATQRGNHYRSTNGGSSFSSIQSGISGSGSWVTPRVMDPSSPTTLYTGTNVVYKTTNSGTSWTAISDALDGSTISCIAVAPSDPQTIYIGYEGYDGKVFKTNNGGTTWTNIETGIPERYPTYLAVHPTNRDIVYCTVSGYSSGHVWKSTNGGSSWSNVSTGLPDIPANCMVMDQTDPNKLYVATDLGVYYSSNAGTSWSDFSAGLPNVVVDFLALHPSTGKLRAGTHGRGMWETETSTPSITVISPNGGEQWSTFTSQNISWGTGGIGGNVSIEINPTYPTGSWSTIIASTANDGSYTWTPTFTGTAARLRVISTSQPSIGDTSNANFTIVSPYVSLITPNGGEDWAVGSQHTIRWTKSSNIGNVQVRIKRDFPNGVWEYITMTTDTFYNWTVTAPTEVDCRIRILQDGNEAISDTSASDFTISGPYLVVNEPNGGEVLYPGQNFTIQWTRYNFSGMCKAEVNYSYPSSSWTLLADSIWTDSLVWPVGAQGSNAARIRVSSHDYASAIDTSNSNFIVQYPFLQVTSPNTGVTWLTGTTQTITWSHSNIYGNFNVYVNRAYPTGSWELVALNQSGTSCQWVVDGPTTSTARIRVTSVNLPTYYDESNTNFTIGDGSPGITVTAPNGGESWMIGTNQTITWSRNVADGPATVAINRSYPTGSWENIATSNTGNSQGWTVTGPVTSSARIRVTLNSNPAITDVSNANFSVVQPSLTLTVPNGGESYLVSQTIPVTFTRTNATGNVTVQLMRNYPGGSWETLSTAVSTSSYNWAATGPATTTARIRVTLNSDPSVGDTSAANFTIIEPSLTLNAPNGGETWNIGTTQVIRWTRDNASGGVRVMLNSDYPSGSWTQLASSVTVDTFAWAVSGAVTNAARIRVYLVSNPTLADTSAANFTISNPALTITSPNGGESLLLGAPHTVRWTRANASGNITIQFMRNYPTGSWEQITNSVATDSFSWTPSGAANSNVRLRIFLTSQPSVGDTSNANFALVNPSITVTAPNGGETWPLGSQQVIRFARSFAPGNATVQLNRSGGSGAWETLTSSCAADTFALTLSGAASANCLVRVRLTSDTTITDNSNAAFSIVQPALTVVSPNGGEQLTLGGTATLRFSRYYASGAVTIKLNRDFPNGVWENLTTNCLVDTFVWNVNGAATSAARIRVELNGGGANSDESNANFTLLQRTLALTSHNSGTYYVGTTSPISISRTNADGAVTVQLNRSYPGGSWETLASGVTGSSYNWNVTTPISSAARIRVIHETYSWVGDTSDANLQIENASLTLLAPASGAVWAIGSSQNVAWTKSGTTSPVRVEFMRSYPSGSWEVLSASETDTLYTWNVSGAVSTAARFRVVATANSSLADTSDAVEIAQPTLTLTAPADNGTFNIGFPMTISWSRYLASGSVTVQINRSYPSASWATIGTTTADSLVWTVTSPASSSARFRVYLTAQSTVGDTTGNETIYLPSLTVNSPNGGEQIRYGLPATISWARNNLSGPVRVDVNSNYPSASWTTLATGQTGNSFSWTVAENPTATARVRVIYEQAPAYGDTSNSNFAIFRPELTLTSPSGGEQWVTGNSYTVSFTRTDHSEPVTIRLNRSYPNGSWETIASNVTTNSASWTASGTPSTSARIRIESSVYSGVGDTMSANFSILNPGVTLLTPDGGESYAIGHAEVIRFQRVQVNAVDVYLNRSYPSGSWEALATNMQADSFTWTATGPATTSARIRVQNSSNSQQTDVSAGNFSILQPAIALLTPVPGDTLAIGVPNLITFSRNSAATGNVRVDANLNYPSGSWQQIGLTVANDLYWTPSGSPSANVRLRIVHLDIPNVSDTLDFNVPLDFASLTLTAPLGASSYEVGDTLRLSWTRWHVGVGVNVYLNRTYPTGAWELLSSNVQADSYNWIVTGPRSSAARLRILSTRNASLGDSTLTQTILVPAIALTSPNSGTLGLGNVETISFTRTDFSTGVAIDLNTAYPGGAWQTIASGLTGNSFDWTVAGSESGTARLRVRSEEYGVLDVSDNDLNIITPAINITTLNSAQLFQNGDPVQIIWSKTAAPGAVNIELNRDYPGGVWESIANGVTQNSHTWTVSGAGFAHGRVRVSMASRSEIFDVNDADFGTFLPALQVLDPNGGDTLVIGDSKTIHFARNGATGSARIQLNRNWPTGSWETLLAQTSSDNYTWTISGPATLNARIRVQLVFDSEVYDVSDENFAILPESLVLLDPQGGDSVAIGDTVIFRWQRVGIDPGVTVYLKRNYPSGQWTLLANAVQSDTFAWVATGDPAPFAHFRVISSWNSQLGDTAGACPLGTPTLLVTDPAVADTYLVGGTAHIAWTRSFAPGSIRVELSRNGVSGPWSSLGTTTENSFDWVVTEPVTSSARFRVSMVDKPWVQGAVTFNSTIVIPDLDLTSPEPGDTLVVGREVVVAWTRQYVNDPVDVLLDRGTPVSDIEMIREGVAGDSIHWIVTPPLSANTRFILRTASGVFVEEDGDTSFVMAEPMVSLLSPNGGEAFIVGQTATITWTRAAVNDPVNIALDRNYPSGTWESLGTGLSGSSLNWSVAGAPSENARIRVTSTVDGNLTDASDAAFAIIQPEIAFVPALPARIPLGFAQDISWQTDNLSGTFSLYLSRNNGISYDELLATGLSGASYTWTPSGSPANLARVKIQSDQLPQVYVESPSFVLAQPQITVASPQNGESFTLGFPLTMRWTRADHPGAVKVELNRNYPSGAWELVAGTVNADSVVWTASGASTSSARIRVTSLINGSWMDIGDANFTLVQANLTILAPAEESEFVLGSPVWITWQRTGWSGSVSVNLNRVGGNSTTISAGTTADTLSWTIDGDEAGSSWLVVRSLDNPTWADSILVNGPYAPALAITSPAPGERCVLGEAHTIRWTREHLAQSVEVYLNSGGQSFVLLGTSLNDSLTFIPESGETNGARVMIRSTDRPDVVDTSETFRLVAPELTMTPVSSPDFRAGVSAMLSWQSHEIIGDVVCELSRNGLAGPWVELFRGTDSSFEWTPETPETENGRLRVRSAEEPQFSDVLNQAITIFQPTLAIARAVQEDTMYFGQTVTLNITGNHIAEHISETVIVVLDRDGVYESLGDVEVPGQMNVTLTEPASNHARFRAYVAGDDELQAASGTFVLRSPELEWSSVPGEDVQAGETIELSWLAEGLPGTLELARLDENGETVLVPELSGDSYDWMVAGPRGTTRLILRVPQAPQWADTTPVFTVHVPELIWATPAESGVDTSGQNLLLSWNALDGAQPVHIEAAFDGEWETLAASLLDTSYFFLLPIRSAETLQFRVTSVEHPDVSALSPVRQLVSRALEIDAGEDNVWYIGEQRWIHWTRENANGPIELDVAFGDRAEGNWLSLAESEADSFLWTVEGEETEFAALRVRLADDGAVFDTTDSPLAIRLPSITVLEPNNGGAYDVDQVLRIRWESEGLPAGVHVGLWRGAPVNAFDTLFVATENDGEEEWTITGPAADSCYVIIASEADTSIHDISDVHFRITGGTSADPRNQAIPQEISLGLPYPNPFNSTLTIPFDLPQPAHVTITIFDVLGREVATLDEGLRPAGYLRTQWQADRVTSGMYFVRMQSEEFSDVRRVQLIK